MTTNNNCLVAGKSIVKVCTFKQQIRVEGMMRLLRCSRIGHSVPRRWVLCIILHLPDRVLGKWVGAIWFARRRDEVGLSSLQPWSCSASKGLLFHQQTSLYYRRQDQSQAWPITSLAKWRLCGKNNSPPPFFFAKQHTQLLSRPDEILARRLSEAIVGAGDGEEGFIAGTWFIGAMLSTTPNDKRCPNWVPLGHNIAFCFSNLSSRSLADKIERRYSKPEHYSVVTVALPKIRDNDILVCYSGPQISSY